jgi:hypothetical protein
MNERYPRRGLFDIEERKWRPLHRVSVPDPAPRAVGDAKNEVLIRVASIAPYRVSVTLLRFSNSACIFICSRAKSTGLLSYSSQPILRHFIRSSDRA